MSEASFDVGALLRSSANLQSAADAASADVAHHLSPVDAPEPRDTHLSRPLTVAGALRPVLAESIAAAVGAQQKVARELDDAARQFAGAEMRAEALARSLEGKAADVPDASASVYAATTGTATSPFSRVPDGPFSDDLADDIARLRRAWQDAPPEVRHLFAPQAFLDELTSLGGEVGPLVADSARIRATQNTLLGLADLVEDEAAALSRSWEGYAALVMRATMRTLAADDYRSAGEVGGLAAQQEILLNRIREQRDVVAGQALRISRTIDQASGAAHAGHPAALKLWVFVRGDRAIRDVIELRNAVTAHGEACNALAEFYRRCGAPEQ